MPQRTWVFEGQTFISPNWTQQGKPYQINEEIRQKWFGRMQQPEESKKSLFGKIKDWFKSRKQKTESNENIDQSVYFKKGTQEDDMEEDFGLLNDEDMLW